MTRGSMLEVEYVVVAVNIPDAWAGGVAIGSEDGVWNLGPSFQVIRNGEFNGEWRIARVIGFISHYKTIGCIAYRSVENMLPLLLKHQFLLPVLKVR